MINETTNLNGNVTIMVDEKIVVIANFYASINVGTGFATLSTEVVNRDLYNANKTLVETEQSTFVNAVNAKLVASGLVAII